MRTSVCCAELAHFAGSRYFVLRAHSKMFIPETDAVELRKWIIKKLEALYVRQPTKEDLY